MIHDLEETEPQTSPGEKSLPGETGRIFKIFFLL